MEESKVDKIIQEKFANRTIETSLSAWDRLEEKLDTAVQKKKGFQKYKLLGLVASIAILLMVYIEQTPLVIKEKTLPQEELLTPVLLPLKKETPLVLTIPKKEEKIIVSVVKEKIIIPTIAKKKTNKKDIKKSKIAVLENVEDSKPILLTSVKKKEKALLQEKRIKVNSDALLYAVTHSSEEVNRYYASLQITREAVLDTIKSQIEKTKLEVNPELILAEVEQEIENDTFKGNNFIEQLKYKITDIAIAIADRNK